MSGDLKPADVPGAWNEKFQQMFGLAPPDDRHAGACRTFTGALAGSVIFQLIRWVISMRPSSWHAARSQLPRLDTDFAAGQFGRLKDWLNEKVHRPGRSYRSGELCRRVTGEGLRHAPLVDYLRGKFGRLYDL